MSDYLLAQLRAEREKEARLDAELSKMSARLNSNPSDDGARQRVENLTVGLHQARDRIAELENQQRSQERLREAATNPANREAGTDFGVGPQERRGHVFDEVQRQLEALHRSADLTTEAVDRLDLHLRSNDPVGVDSQYVAAVSQPEYATAFGKILAHGDAAAVLRMSDAERSAVEQVYLAEKQRAMAEGTPSSGGYALPITIDPTMNLMSSGAINPIRQLAQVRTISTLELRLLATDGVVASYAQEATEALDNSPALAQPDLFVERAQCFVPVSFELFEDWTNLQDQLITLFSDAKDVLESQKFLTGAGHASFEPNGILGGAAGSLTASQEVATSGVASVSTHDLYALRAAIPPRFLGNAQVCVSPAIQDVLWNLVPRASTTDNTIMPDREHLLELPLHPWSTMATGLTTGNKIAIAGDFKKGYVVADRLGLSVELVPHLFGANRRPTGQRGLYAYWRNTGSVISSSDNAPLRYLQTS